MSSTTGRPHAPQLREEAARDLFPVELSPEEYAARHAHEWACFSFDDYQYSDPRLDAWIQRLGEILFQRTGAPAIAELRARFLTSSEIAEIERRSKEDL